MVEEISDEGNSMMSTALVLVIYFFGQLEQFGGVCKQAAFLFFILKEKIQIDFVSVFLLRVLQGFFVLLPFRELMGELGQLLRCHTVEFIQNDVQCLYVRFREDFRVRGFQGFVRMFADRIYFKVFTGCFLGVGKFGVLAFQNTFGVRRDNAMG